MHTVSFNIAGVHFVVLFLRPLVLLFIIPIQGAAYNNNRVEPRNIKIYSINGSIYHFFVKIYQLFANFILFLV